MLPTPPIAGAVTGSMQNGRGKIPPPPNMRAIQPKHTTYTGVGNIHRGVNTRATCRRLSQTREREEITIFIFFIYRRRFLCTL
jgi:hypothetical protein